MDFLHSKRIEDTLDEAQRTMQQVQLAAASFQELVRHADEAVRKINAMLDALRSGPSTDAGWVPPEGKMP